MLANICIYKIIIAFCGILFLGLKKRLIVYGGCFGGIGGAVASESLKTGLHSVSVVLPSACVGFIVTRTVSKSLEREVTDMTSRETVYKLGRLVLRKKVVIRRLLKIK